MKNDDLCKCACHKNKGIMHCVPCCYQCAYCHKDIATHKFSEHMKNCKYSQEKEK